jgi:hypothetical protein
MFPFGHVGIAIFLARFLNLPIVFAAVGVLLPDLIDKGFFELGLLPCGRSLAHSVFFAPVSAAILFALTRNKKIAITFFFGAFLHLAQDLFEVPLFYPLVHYNFNCQPMQFVLTTYNLVGELVGAPLLFISVFYKEKLFKLRDKILQLHGRAAEEVREQKK